MKRSSAGVSLTRVCGFGARGVAVTWCGGGVVSVRFVARPGPSQDDAALRRALEAALATGRVPRELRTRLEGLSPFAGAVLVECARVMPGTVVTYAELARRAGHRGAARAVGQVMAGNPVPLLVSCHRVVGAGLRLHGYGGGLAMKAQLLRSEGWQVVGTGRGRRVLAR